MKTSREPMAHRLPPARRRQFLKLCGAVLAAPAVPAALRFAVNEQLFGEAHAFEAESSLPTYFIEMNLRDQWDFGHVFVPPGIATNLANITRGGSGDALSFFYTADKISAHEGNFYLTPDSEILIPYLSNIAVLETNPLCEGAIHGHESANPLRSPGRTKSQDPGKQPMWMGEPGYEEQGNDYWYSSTPTPATLHNYWQKQLTPELANGITMKFISRFHTISHFAAGLGPLVLPQSLEGSLSTAEKERIRREYGEAIRNLNARRWVLGLRALREWPMAWVTQLGPDVRLVLGYLLYKADLIDDAVEHLEELLDDPAYLQKHPAALYYLARAEFNNGEPRRAVEHMARYLKMRDAPEAAPAPSP